jgi:hypothetical protein
MDGRYSSGYSIIAKSTRVINYTVPWAVYGGLSWPELQEYCENMLKKGKIDLFTLNQNFLLLLMVDCHF